MSGALVGDSSGLRRGLTKSDSGLRHFSLAPAAIKALKLQRKSQLTDRMKAGSAWIDSPFVFTTARGGAVEPQRGRGSTRDWRNLPGCRIPGCTLYAITRRLRGSVQVGPRSVMWLMLSAIPVRRSRWTFTQRRSLKRRQRRSTRRPRLSSRRVPVLSKPCPNSALSAVVRDIPKWGSREETGHR